MSFVCTKMPSEEALLFSGLMKVPAGERFLGQNKQTLTGECTRGLHGKEDFERHAGLGVDCGNINDRRTGCVSQESHVDKKRLQLYTIPLATTAPSRGSGSCAKSGCPGLHALQPCAVGMTKQQNIKGALRDPYSTFFKRRTQSKGHTTRKTFPPNPRRKKRNRTSKAYPRLSKNRKNATRKTSPERTTKLPPPSTLPPAMNFTSSPCGR